MSSRRQTSSQRQTSSHTIVHNLPPLAPRRAGSPVCPSFPRIGWEYCTDGTETQTRTITLKDKAGKTLKHRNRNDQTMTCDQRKLMCTGGLKKRAFSHITTESKNIESENDEEFVQAMKDCVYGIPQTSNRTCETLPTTSADKGTIPGWPSATRHPRDICQLVTSGDVDQRTAGEKRTQKAHKQQLAAANQGAVVAQATGGDPPEGEKRAQAGVTPDIGEPTSETRAAAANAKKREEALAPNIGTNPKEKTEALAEKRAKKNASVAAKIAPEHWKST